MCKVLGLYIVGPIHTDIVVDVMFQAYAMPVLVGQMYTSVNTSSKYVLPCISNVSAMPIDHLNRLGASM